MNPNQNLLQNPALNPHNRVWPDLEGLDRQSEAWQTAGAAAGNLAASAVLSPQEARALQVNNLLLKDQQRYEWRPAGGNPNLLIRYIVQNS